MSCSSKTDMSIGVLLNERCVNDFDASQTQFVGWLLSSRGSCEKTCSQPYPLVTCERRSGVGRAKLNDSLTVWLSDGRVKN